LAPRCGRSGCSSISMFGDMYGARGGRGGRAWIGSDGRQKGGNMKDAEHRELALRALGVLIERANSLLAEEMTLSYKGLAGRIGYPGPLSGRRFGVEIGKTLRFMAALLDGPAVSGRRVPRIQCLVVRRDTGIPGAGFFRQPLPRLAEARVLARAERDRVAAFGAARWRRVLLRARSRTGASRRAGA